jgi:1-acyl-sn-glycerol-3-phosphate acyltransferase
LQAGQSICIFPEGTTSNGQQILPFHASLFQAAIDAGVVVQPIYLNYSHSAAAYIDNISLLASVCSVLLAPKLQVTLVKSAILPTALQTRQHLATEAHQQVVNEYAKQISNDVPN